MLALLCLALTALPAQAAHSDDEDTDSGTMTNTVQLPPDRGVMTNTPPLSNALTRERRETFSLEILGRGGAYSLGFDRMLGRDFALGLGLGLFTIDGLNHSATMLVIPAYTNYYFNDDLSRAYLTLGVSAISATEAVDEFGFTGGGLGATAGFGYEFRGARGGLLRITPYVLYSRGHFTFTAGLTLGNAFF